MTSDDVTIAASGTRYSCRGGCHRTSYTQCTFRRTVTTVAQQHPTTNCAYVMWWPRVLILCLFSITTCILRVHVHVYVSNSAASPCSICLLHVYMSNFAKSSQKNQMYAYVCLHDAYLGVLGWLCKNRLSDIVWSRNIFRTLTLTGYTFLALESLLNVSS